MRSGGSTDYKIGVTSSVNDRIAALQTGNPEKLTVGFVISLSPKNDIGEIEVKLHKLLSAQRIHGEWFRLACSLDYDTVVDWLNQSGLVVVRSLRKTIYVKYDKSNWPPEKFRVIARHKWVAGAFITESVKVNQVDSSTASIRRFTATIRGFRSWRIYQGESFNGVANYVIATVKEIRNRIDAGDDSIFDEPNAFAIANTSPKVRKWLEISKGH